MPQVGNKKFPYTPKGIAQAKQAMGRQNKIKQAVNALNAQLGAKGPFPTKPGFVKPPGIGGPATPGYPPTGGPRPTRLPSGLRRVRQSGPRPTRPLPNPPNQRRPK